MPWPSASRIVVFGSYEPDSRSTQPRAPTGSSWSSRIETASPSRTRSRPSPGAGRRDLDDGRLRRLGKLEDPAPEGLARDPGRVAGDERLPRCRCLAGVGGQVGVGGGEREGRDRHAEGIRGDLGDDGGRSLPDVGRTREQADWCRLARSRCRRSRGWAATCCRCRTTWPRCRRRAGADRRSRSARSLNACGLGAQRDPARLERVQARGEPGARGEDLPGSGGGARSQGVPAPDLELVEAELRGQVVEQRLVRDRRLGHAEAAERAGGRAVRVDGGRRGLGGRHGVRAHRVDGDAVGHRGTPRGVGAGVEVAVEADAGEPPVGVGAERRLDPRRVALRSSPASTPAASTRRGPGVR